MDPITLLPGQDVTITAPVPPPPPPPPPPTPVALGITATDIQLPDLTWRRDSWASVQGTLTGSVPPITQKYLPLILTKPQGGSWGDLTGDTLGWLNDSIAVGSCPLITWEWRDFSLDPAGIQTAFNNNAVLSGKWDSLAVAWLLKLKAWLGADARNRVGLRLLHEGNGRWYPWGCGPGNVNGNKAYTYIGAFRHIAGMIRSTLGPQLAPQAPIIWTPGTRGGGWDLLENNYPGSANVDYLGCDIYNGETLQGGWLEFGDATRPFYDRLCALDPTKGIIVAETGCDESAAQDKAAWYTTMLSSLPVLPRIRAVIEFDRANSQGHNWSVSQAANANVYPAWKALSADPFMAGQW